MPRTYGKSKGKAKQTRLSFVPASFASDDHDGNTDRLANLRYSHPSAPTLRRGRVSNGKKSESSAPAPFVTASTPGDSSDSETETPTRKSSLRTKEKRPSLKKKSTSNIAPPSSPPVPQDSDSDIEVLHSARKKMRSGTLRKRPLSHSDGPSSPLAVQDSDSDIEILHSARKKMRSGALKRKRSPKTPESESSEPANTHISEESEADDVVARPRRKLRRGGTRQTITVDDDTSEEKENPSATPVQSKKVHSEIPHTPRRGSDQDKIDLEEDLEALQDSVVRESRTRGNIANSARAHRQRHLEALRRRRAGRKEEDDGEDQLSPQPEEPEEAKSESEGEDERPVRQPQLRGWAGESESSDVESSIGINEDLDRYEDDFVLEDEDDKLGVPGGLEDMPIEFSRHAYKQLKDYFQDAVEWMVHNQLNPAFPRSDPVYKVAFDKLEAEVRGRTGSQLVSSVWNTDFRRALLARPQIEVTTFPTDFCHSCDACNRSGHPASFDVKLYGKAYALDTLESLVDADSDDEQSDSDESGREKDRDGHILPDEDTRFYLGRHCMKNASMAHTLTHWRFHLNEWVIEHLRVLGYLTDEKILKRSHWSQRKKNKHAAKAVNKMIESGEVKKLWRDFHINLRTARESTAI